MHDRIQPSKEVNYRGWNIHPKLEQSYFQKSIKVVASFWITHVKNIVHSQNIYGDVRNSYVSHVQFCFQKQEMLAEHHSGRLPLRQEALIDKLAPPSLCQHPVKTRYAGKCTLHYV